MMSRFPSLVRTRTARAFGILSPRSEGSASAASAASATSGGSASGSTAERRAKRIKSRVIIAGVAAIGALAWAGCGSDSGSRYYCDSTGCYDCDAYGCSSVAPPAKQACTGTTSCPPGSVCTASGCTTACSEGAPCPKGEVCKAGLCAAPTTEPGPAKECTTKGDCGEGKACVAGACKVCGGTAGPCPCSAASDCAADQVCSAGTCTDAGNLCRFSSECDTGRLCANGQCLTSCETAPCATGFQCDKGVCKPVVVGPSGCTSNDQCGGETPRCVGGNCVAACTGPSDPSCAAGTFCDQGACVPDTRPKPNCTDDAQCGSTPATPKKCLDGFCKYTCSAAQGDAYCRTIDARIGFCAKDLVCRTSAEANAECVDATTCAPGQSCIDNRCK